MRASTDVPSITQQTSAQTTTSTSAATTETVGYSDASAMSSASLVTDPNGFTYSISIGSDGTPVATPIYTASAHADYSAPGYFAYSAPVVFPAAIDQSALSQATQESLEQNTARIAILSEELSRVKTMLSKYEASTTALIPKVYALTLGQSQFEQTLVNEANARRKAITELQGHFYAYGERIQKLTIRLEAEEKKQATETHALTEAVQLFDQKQQQLFDQLEKRLQTQLQSISAAFENEKRKREALEQKVTELVTMIAAKDKKAAEADATIQSQSIEIAELTQRLETRKTIDAVNAQTFFKTTGSISGPATKHLVLNLPGRFTKSEEIKKQIGIPGSVSAGSARGTQESTDTIAATTEVPPPSAPASQMQGRGGQHHRARRGGKS